MAVQRGHRILGGPCGPDQRPSTSPLLHKLEVAVFRRPAGRYSKLHNFPNSSIAYRSLRQDEEAFVVFPDRGAWIALDGVLELKILCGQKDQQLSILAQVYRSSFPTSLLPTVANLYVICESGFSQLNWPDDMQSRRWLELFCPFTAVVELYLAWEIVPRIAPALRELIGESRSATCPAASFLEDALPSELGLV